MFDNKFLLDSETIVLLFQFQMAEKKKRKKKKN